MQIIEHDSIAALQRLAKKERDGRVRQRAQGVILARRGHTCFEVAEALGVSDRTAREWVARYNRDGYAGLQEQPGRGRPARLEGRAVERFKARLEKGVRPEDGVCTLRGIDIMRILEQEFGVSYTLSGVYRLLHRLGYSSLMPRPRHHKADGQAQGVFKKTARSGASTRKANRAAR
jgi:transposase